MANIINDNTGQQAAQLVDALTTKQINRLAANAGIESVAAATPTEDPVTFINPAAGSDYTPAFSGFAYSADLINPATTDAVTTADLLELGYIDVGPGQFAIKAQTRSDQSGPNPVNSATSTGVKNNMFGFLVNQHAAQQSLLNINLQLRGDPWYLLGPKLTADSSTPEQMNPQKDCDLFWLEIRSPITYDPDFTDEDSALNSGYWKYDGVSQTLSALYEIKQVKCTFSGGIFTVDVQALHSGISASNIDKEAVKSESTEADAAAQAATQAALDNLGELAGDILEDTFNDLLGGTGI